MKLGIVVGLEAEARIAAPLGLVEIGGGTARGAEEAVIRLLHQGVEGLLSFGFAGGLSPVLRPGHLLVPDTVVVDGMQLQTDAALASRFSRRRGVLLGAHAVLGGGGGTPLRGQPRSISKAVPALPARTWRSFPSPWYGRSAMPGTGSCRAS